MTAPQPASAPVTNGPGALVFQLLAGVEEGWTGLAAAHQQRGTRCSCGARRWPCRIQRTAERQRTVNA